MKAVTFQALHTPLAFETLPDPTPGDGELDMTGLLAILDEAGYAGPISAEVEFDERGWPGYETCQAAAKRSVENLRGMGLTV